MAPTVMTQTWSNIVWAHWPVEPGQVTGLLPPGLTPEIHEGRAWVGLIPFQMSGLHLAGGLSSLSPLLGVDSFGEVNVRTYVRGPDGRTGVWFLTLDADRLLAVVAARVAFGLPYRRAAIQFTDTTERAGGHLDWTSVRRGDGATANIRVTPEDARPRLAAPGLEQFLVERYSLYSWWHGRLLRGTLSHAPWLVRGAHAINVDSGTVAAAGIPVDGAPHVLVGGPADVRIHPFKLLRPASLHQTRVGTRRPVAKVQR